MKRVRLTLDQALSSRLALTLVREIMTGASGCQTSNKNYSDLQRSHFTASTIGFNKWLSGETTSQLHSARLNTRMYSVQMPRGLVDANSCLEKRPGGRLDLSDSLNKIAMGNFQALKHGLDRVTFHI